MVTMNSNIKDYIDLVRSKKIPVCNDQLLLCDFVERVFKTEKLFVNESQLEKYMTYQKYFPFDLLPWEKFCFALHNCVYRENGQLRFPVLFILVGRGAGKNGFEAFEDFCLLTPTNGVREYDIDIFAMCEDQAKRSFTDVYNVLDTNENKMKHFFYWNLEYIKNLQTNSVLKFRTSGRNTKDSMRPGKVSFDEYHAYENTKIVDTAVTGLGKKKHPRRTIITTNGDVRDGPLDRLINKSERILRREISDNGMLPFMCHIENKEEIDDKKMWTKANPTLAYVGSLEYADTLFAEMEQEYADYLDDPYGNSTFSTKRMNCPQGNKEFEVTSWDNILATNREIPDLVGCPCVLGIDFAEINDFATAGLLFKKNDMYYWISHTWVCKQSRDLPRVKFPIEVAEKRGELTIVDDIQIGGEDIAGWIYKKSKKYNIIHGALDRFRYSVIKKELSLIGFEPEKKQGGQMSGKLTIIKPGNIEFISNSLSLEFARHQIIWGDDSTMRWFTQNAKRVVNGKNGNVSFGKIEPKSRKTDGFMAYVAARCISDKLDAIIKMNSVKTGGCWTY